MKLRTFFTSIPRAEVGAGRSIVGFVVAPIAPALIFAVAAFLWAGFDFGLLWATLGLGAVLIIPLCYVAAVVFGIPVYQIYLRLMGGVSIWFCVIGGALIGEVFASLVTMMLRYGTPGETAWWTWRFNGIFPLTGLIAGFVFWVILRWPAKISPAPAATAGQTPPAPECLPPR